jgi:hypothetical protein
MVLVKMDGSYIGLKPMLSRETNKLIRVYNNIIDRLKIKRQGIQSKHQMLGNEAPKVYLEAIKNHGIDWQLATRTTPQSPMQRSQESNSNCKCKRSHHCKYHRTQ